jgi:hypothetical protein
MGVIWSSANLPCHGMHLPSFVWTVWTFRALHDVHSRLFRLMLLTVHSYPHRSQVITGTAQGYLHSNRCANSGDQRG